MRFSHRCPTVRALFPAVLPELIAQCSPPAPLLFSKIPPSLNLKQQGRYLHGEETEPYLL